MVSREQTNSAPVWEIQPRTPEFSPGKIEERGVSLGFFGSARFCPGLSVFFWCKVVSAWGFVVRSGASLGIFGDFWFSPVPSRAESGRIGLSLASARFVVFCFVFSFSPDRISPLSKKHVSAGTDGNVVIWLLPVHPLAHPLAAIRLSCFSLCRAVHFCRSLSPISEFIQKILDIRSTGLPCPVIMVGHRLRCAKPRAQEAHWR